ncbi:VrrA/YqfQ family protein [Ornithinibacillus sp. 4-3]|uniref:VrrA/YqfQ family protein n=1 Tax=Ornithinibacillus sp. 4-3 TaxID=3231488 RepID=A0AB39HJ80_9BACI
MLFANQSRNTNQNFTNRNHPFFPQRNFQAPVPQTQSKISSIPNLINKGVGGLSKSLGNIQQVLQVVDSATPLVQQYGPLVKNLPAMYRMMKAFKNIDLEEETATDVEDLSTPPVHEDNKDSINMVKSNTVRKGNSLPRLYV